MSEYEYKLTVVVLVYNTEAYLEECLDSLVNQTLDNIEIICVNDESKDNSLNILRKYEKKYDNIRVIDQKNAGGANAGNRGLKEAKGEYVALVDSDDVVVEDAYEKMYNKAKETDSDIVCGKPRFYINNFQRDLKLRHEIWNENKTFKPDDYLDIYYDVFYWNKIYRREFVEKYEIYMIPGKLYADVPLVFRSYLFANKITIIKDFVYYWRRRPQNLIIKGDSETSVSQSLAKIENMEDRVSTYYYLKDYFKEAGKEHIFNHIIKTYLERFTYPINGILKDNLFEDKYIKEMKKILNDIDDLYSNNLHLIYNLYIYLILNDEHEILKELISFHRDDNSILNEKSKSYWGLKYFRNKKYNIPDEIFEIKELQNNFISIKEICSNSNYIYMNEISLPKNIKIDNIKLSLRGLTKKYNLYEKNTYNFNLKKIEQNKYNAKIPIKEIKNINIYDPHLEFEYNNHTEIFRLNKYNFINKDIKYSDEEVKPYFTQQGNLSIQIFKVENLFNINIDEEGIIISEDEGDINYDLFIGTDKESDNVYFVRNYENKALGKFKNELELKWKYSLEKNIEYKLYCHRRKDEHHLLNTNYFKNYEDKIINYNNMKIKVYENEDKTISIKMIS